MQQDSAVQNSKKFVLECRCDTTADILLRVAGACVSLMKSSPAVDSFGATAGALTVSFFTHRSALIFNGLLLDSMGKEELPETSTVLSCVISTQKKDVSFDSRLSIENEQKLQEALQSEVDAMNRKFGSADGA